MRFAGEHIELVGLQKRTVTYDEFNQPVDTWNHYKDLYAEFWERQAKEGEVENQIIVLQDVRCKIRFVPELNERDYRIKRGDILYDIQSIVKEGRRTAQLLILERRDNS